MRWAKLVERSYLCLCPKCGEFASVLSIDQSRQLKCASCSSRFLYDPKRSKAHLLDLNKKTKGSAKGVHVSRQAGTLKLKYNSLYGANSWLHVVLSLGFLVLMAKLIFGSGLGQNQFYMKVLFGAAQALLSIFLWDAFIKVYSFDVTHSTVAFQIRGLLGSKQYRYNVADIENFAVEKIWQRSESEWKVEVVLTVHFKSSKKAILIRDLEMDQAVFLEVCLEKFLGINDDPLKDVNI